MRYCYSISHVTGKELIIADAHSLSPTNTMAPEMDNLLPEQVDEYVYEII